MISIPTVWDPVKRLPWEKLADKLATSPLTAVRFWFGLVFFWVPRKHYHFWTHLCNFCFSFFSQMLSIFVISRGLIGMTSKSYTPLGEDVPKTQDCQTRLKEEVTLSTYRAHRVFSWCPGTNNLAEHEMHTQSDLLNSNPATMKEEGACDQNALAQRGAEALTWVRKLSCTALLLSSHRHHWGRWLRWTYWGEFLLNAPVKVYLSLTSRAKRSHRKQDLLTTMPCFSSADVLW